MDDFRCITLHQPYASLVARGAKTIETRTWRTHYRGWIAIHASKRLYTAADKHANRDLFFAAHDVLELERSGGVYGLPYGEVVAVAQLTDCIPSENVILETTAYGWERWGEGAVIANQAQFDLGDLGTGNWAWLLTDIRPLAEPVPAKGRQGLWRPAPVVAAQIRLDLSLQDARAAAQAGEKVSDG